jgi:hypothetical protein
MVSAILTHHRVQTAEIDIDSCRYWRYSAGREFLALNFACRRAVRRLHKLDLQAVAGSSTDKGNAGVRRAPSLTKRKGKLMFGQPFGK